VNVTHTNSPIEENEVLEVVVNVTNTGDEAGTENIELVGDEGQVLDNETVTLNSSETKSVTLEWDTESGDGGTTSITVAGAGVVNEVVAVEVGELLQRRNAGRGKNDETPEHSRELGRGEVGERDDLRRDSGRNRRANRPDRGRILYQADSIFTLVPT